MISKPTGILIASVFSLSMLGMSQPENRSGEQTLNSEKQPLEQANQPEHTDQPTNARPKNAQRSPQEGERDQIAPRKRLEIRIDPESLRARLNRSIMRAEQMLERNKAALAKLDEGASPAEVLAEIRVEGFDRPQQREGQEPSRKPLQASGRESSRPDANHPTLNPKERAQMYQFLRENFPKLAKDLDQIAQLDRRNGDRLLARMAPQIREILFLNKTQPELGEIKIEEMRIGLDFVEASRNYRKIRDNPASTDSEKADAIASLHALAGQRFDIQIKSQQFEIDRLEARLNELKDSAEGIQERRDTEIEHMVEAAKLNARRDRTRQKPDARPKASRDD